MTNYPTDNIVTYDLEVFPGYFLAGFETPDGTVYQYTHHDLEALLTFMEWVKRGGYTLAGFNSIGYDDLVLTAFLRDPRHEIAYETSYSIIQVGTPRWRFDNDINSIDLMQILPGRISLKKIGVCLGHSKLQELPIAYDKTPTPEEQQILLGYNRNDLAITRKLLNQIQPELDLRRIMSERYDTDMRSKGEATMAEAAILEEFWRLGGIETKKQLNQRAHAIVSADPRVFVAQPSWWSTAKAQPNPEMEAVLSVGDEIFSTPIPVIDGRLASGFLDKQLFIGDRYYTTGVGGLHSIDGAGSWIPKDDEILVDIDVASYYPNIILTQKLSPRQWGEAFLPIYQGIVDRRMKAKRKGDKVTARILKISANGTYGKTSDQFSSLYDPQMTANVTVVGQLGLLTLIAMLEGAGVARVVSANTDGMSVLAKQLAFDDVKDIVAYWEQMTGLEMEYTEYSALYQRDVNNYIALKPDGKAKTKGRFVCDWPDLRHTPNANIVAIAIKNLVREGKSLENTIYECDDINQFILTQSVTGNWTTTWNNAPLGKMLRFYKSNCADAAPIIRTPGEGVKGNQGVVSNSDKCVPLEDLPDEFPKDVNYAWYINEAKELWEAISQPKRTGMNRWAEFLHRQGLRPCMVDPNAKTLSRARVEYGTTDFSSMPPGWELGTGTGDGLLAALHPDRADVFTVNRPFPSKTRKLVKTKHGFELIYGARVPLKGAVKYDASGLADESQLDAWYTPAELKKVGR